MPEKGPGRRRGGRELSRLRRNSSLRQDPCQCRRDASGNLRAGRTGIDSAGRSPGLGQGSGTGDPLHDRCQADLAFACDGDEEQPAATRPRRWFSSRDEVSSIIRVENGDGQDQGASAVLLWCQPEGRLSPVSHVLDGKPVVSRDGNGSVLPPEGKCRSDSRIADRHTPAIGPLAGQPFRSAFRTATVGGRGSDRHRMSHYVCGRREARADHQKEHCPETSPGAAIRGQSPHDACLSPIPQPALP